MPRGTRPSTQRRLMRASRRIGQRALPWVVGEALPRVAGARAPLAGAAIVCVRSVALPHLGGAVSWPQVQVAVAASSVGDVALAPAATASAGAGGAFTPRS